MSKVEEGNEVTVHYTGTLSDGTVFDTSRSRDPLTFRVGSGLVIQGFNDAVIGMTQGDVQTFTIDAASAYGPVNEAAVQNVDKSRFPDGFNAIVGETVSGQDGNGRQFSARIIDVMDENVTLDFNHPLAGQDLTFEIEIVSFE